MKNTLRINTAYISSAEETLKLLSKSLEPYKMASESISSSINAMMKSYPTASQLGISNIAETMRNTMKIYTKIDMPYLKTSPLPEALSVSLREIEKTFKLYEQTPAFQSLRVLSDSLNMFSQSIASEQLRQLTEIDYSTLFNNIVPQASSLSEILDSAYSMVQDELSEDNEQEEDFTEEEIQEAFQEQASNPLGFQERIAGWTEKKKIQYFIIWQLICFIYGSFLQPYFQENVGIPVTSYIVSNVKELPQKGAKIICQLKENKEAVVTEDTNYYYKVSFIDESGEKREGYVAKRNLKKIEEAQEEAEK